MSISAYITSYNKGKYLSKAIESILSQSLKPNELIIVDDFSSDESKLIIESFKNRYPNIIKTVFNPSNYGVTKSRNIAITKCSSNIITYLDADDYFLPNKLESEFNLISKNDKVRCVFSNVLYLDKNGNENGFFANKKDQPAEGNILVESFVRSYNVQSGRNIHFEMFYKTAASEIGYYDERIKIWEDWDFRIRMSKNNNYAYCPKVNSVYRDIKDGLSKSDIKLHYREQVKIYNNNKLLLNDLSSKEKDLIKNRIFSQIKYFFELIFLNRSEKYDFINKIYYSLDFFRTFKTIKTMKYLIKLYLGKIK